MGRVMHGGDWQRIPPDQGRRMAIHALDGIHSRATSQQQQQQQQQLQQQLQQQEMLTARMQSYTMLLRVLSECASGGMPLQPSDLDSQQAAGLRAYARAQWQEAKQLMFLNGRWRANKSVETNLAEEILYAFATRACSPLAIILLEEFNIIGLDIIDALSIYQFEDTEFEAGVATLGSDDLRPPLAPVLRLRAAPELHPAMRTPWPAPRLGRPRAACGGAAAACLPAQVGAPPLAVISLGAPRRERAAAWHGQGWLAAPAGMGWLAERNRRSRLHGRM